MDMLFLVVCREGSVWWGLMEGAGSGAGHMRFRSAGRDMSTCEAAVEFTKPKAHTLHLFALIEFELNSPAFRRTDRLGLSHPLSFFHPDFLICK